MPIDVERRDHIGILTLNRPERRNALDAEHSERVGEILDEWERDGDLWVVIVTGAGDQAFSAGMDLKARHAENQEKGERPPRTSRGAGFAGITHRYFPKPLIAAVNGYAMGGGFELCLACDLVVAEQHAKFALSEVKRGLVAGAGGVERLVRAIPPVLAAEYIMTGDFITADKALEYGLVNAVVPSGGSLAAAIALAERVAQSSPLAVRLSKRIMQRSLWIGQSEVDETVLGVINEVMASADTREGVAAFNEKRAPRWTGR